MVDSFINVVVTFVLLTVIYRYFETKSYDVVDQVSKINNKTYLVRNLPDKQQAADTLATISEKLSELVNFIDKNINKDKLSKDVVNKNIDTLYNKYVKEQFEKTISSPNDKKDDEFDSIVKEKKEKLLVDLRRFVNNYNPDKLSETTPDAKYTSYSVNKGEKIVMCIRNKKTLNQSIININTLMFVALHESAHLMTESIGHHQEFWDNFRILINISVDPNVATNPKVPIYKEVDFGLYPQPYCGMTINSVPS